MNKKVVYKKLASMIMLLLPIIRMAQSLSDLTVSSDKDLCFIQLSLEYVHLCRISLT
ncbi:MAG: hypothetical protein IJ532_03605 [Alphaproteobacteria bacterium]|nr:hypothetical protein [Alphaproteobacteria bacterium]